MNCSTLLNDILTRAEAIRREQAMECLTVPCILIAFSELCAREYTGVTPYDQSVDPECYEEERVRCLYKKVFKASGNMMGIYFQKITDQYDTDFLAEYKTVVEATAEGRGKNAVSADVVFLWAIKALNAQHCPTAYPAFTEAFSVEAALAELDGELYGFVVNELHKVAKKLETKTTEAKAKRDWKPAAKFVEPEELTAMLFAAVTAASSNRQAELEIPAFFSEQDSPLRLTICRSEGIYYVRDNGDALRQLRKHTGTEECFQTVWNRIRAQVSVEEGQIIGTFSQAHGFLHYLQTLIFVANGDLYAEQLHEDGLYCDPGNTFVSEEKQEPFDAKELWELLKDRISCGYDKNEGLYLAVYTTYALNCTTVAFRIETLEDGSLRLSDHCKGKIEGEIFETFYFSNDDLTPYRSCIDRFCRRFGADFDGKDLSLTAKPEDFIPALFRFINLAVLLSEFGRMIELPEEGGSK